MKIKSKLGIAMIAAAITIASCTKPAENADTNGADTTKTDTTTVVVPDTTATTPQDTTSGN